MVGSLVTPLICQESGIVLFIIDSEDQIMATKKKAPAKKAPTRKAPARKASAKKPAAKKGGIQVNVAKKRPQRKKK